MYTLNILDNLNKLVDLKLFYNISISPFYGEIRLQGNFCDDLTQFAKEYGIELVYDQDTKMLRGTSADGTVKIVLT